MGRRTGIAHLDGTEATHQTRLVSVPEESELRSHRRSLKVFGASRASSEIPHLGDGYGYTAPYPGQHGPAQAGGDRERPIH